VALFLVIVVAAVLIVACTGVWFLKRKLASLGEGLPGALQQWEKEIEKLEKPKG